MADQHTKAEKQERPNKDEIKGLPAHAQYQFRQGTWYVYFPYCFREDGKRKQKRDYIGTLSPDGKEFLPNLYYVQHEPDFDHRPVERWKSPVMRQRALEKLNANKVETIAPGVSPDPELDFDQQLSVGTSILNEGREAIAEKAEELVLTTNTSKMIVMLETSAIKRKDKWKVKMGEQTSVFVSVDDQAFIGSSKGATTVRAARSQRSTKSAPASAVSASVPRRSSPLKSETRFGMMRPM